MHILTKNCINVVILLIHSVILTCRPLVTIGARDNYNYQNSIYLIAHNIIIPEGIENVSLACTIILILSPTTDLILQ